MSSSVRVGYIRVSTSSGEQLSALENQRSRVQATGVDQVIQDIQSGRESDRVGYLALLDLIDRRKVDEVVITRVDRLGRDAADVDAAIAFAAKRGVKLTAIDGGTIESETPAGFVMSRIMTTMAEMESRMLSQRIRSGLREGRKKRRPLRGRAPWGYSITPDKTALAPHPVEWHRAQAFLRTLRENNWRMNTSLTVWERQGLGPIPINSCNSVRAWLLNPILRGGIGYNQQPNHLFAEIVWDAHEALITHAEFDHITHQLATNRRMWGHNSDIIPRLLTSLCKCGHCGKSMNYAGGRKIPALVCKARGCPQQYKSTHESVIRDAIFQAIADRALALTNVIATEPPEAQELRDAIKRLEQLNDPDLEDAIQLKREKLQNLHSQDRVDPKLLKEVASPDLLEHLEPEELRLLFQQLVARVEIRDQAVAHVQLRV
jgi:DNA invertase Pin-like site-specific DNA recombinase